MAEMTLVEAVTMALAKAMEEDETVLVLGEDVGPNGGVFRATDGLHERFGGERVFDTGGDPGAACPDGDDRNTLMS